VIYHRDTMKLAVYSQHCMDCLMRQETVNATAVTSSKQAHYSKWSEL